MIKVRTQFMTLNQMQKIIDHRFVNSDFDVSINKKTKNKNCLTNQIFEKIIIGNRRIQNVISSYVVFFQVFFFKTQRFFRIVFDSSFFAPSFFSSFFFCRFFSFFISFPSFFFRIVDFSISTKFCAI